MASTDPQRALRNGGGSLLTLPLEVAQSVIKYLHPHARRQEAAAGEQVRASRVFNLTGYTAVAKHLCYYVEAEARSMLSDGGKATPADIWFYGGRNNPIDLARLRKFELQILRTIAWFFVDPNYIVALLVKYDGIHTFSLGILLPDFRCLNELPPQPHPDITPILRGFAEAIDRGLPLRPPQSNHIPFRASQEPPTSEFVLLWLSSVDAVDMFIDVVQRLESSGTPDINRRLSPVMEHALLIAAGAGSIGTVSNARAQMTQHPRAIASYVAEFVRSIVEDDVLRGELMGSIQQGSPFILTNTLAVVMVDVSGYSKFTAKVAEMGKVSSEIVTESVGRYLNQIISVIYKYEGDIVKCNWEQASFSASTATAPPTTSTYETAKSRKAKSQATTWQTATCIALPGSSTVELRIHVAVTYGKCEQIVYGTPERMDYCVTSPCMSHLGPALDSATSGEIGFSSQAWQALGLTEMSFQLKTQAAGNGEVVHVVEQDFIFSLWEVLSALFEEDERSVGHRRALRRVADSGSPADRTLTMQQDSGTKVDELAVIPKMQEYRDVSIVFVQIKSAQVEIPVQTLQKIMVLFLGALETENGSFQQISGDVITLAARIMSLEAAENKVVCDSSTMLAAEDEHVFEKLGDFLAIQSKKDMATGDVDAILSSSPYQTTPLVGYRGPQERIASMVKSWITTRERCTLILKGASGLGKSTLVNQFIDECVSKDIEVGPYFGIRSILSAAFTLFHKHRLPALTSHPSTSSADLRPSHSRASLSRHSRRMRPISTSRLGLSSDDEECRLFLLFCKQDPRLAPLLADIAPHLKVPENGFTAQLDGEARASNVRLMMVRIINSLLKQGRNLAVVVDDAQWLDPSSVDILSKLIEEVPQLLLLISSRPPVAGAHDSIRKLLSADTAEKMTLDGFTIEETEEFIVRSLKHQNVTGIDPKLMTGNGSYPKALTSLAIREKVGGSPLFTDTIVSSISDAMGETFGVTDDGLLVVRDVDVDVDSFFAADIGTAIRSQFDRLEPRFQELLRVASVFGQYFDLDDVREAYRSETTTSTLTTLIKDYDMFNFLHATTYDFTPDSSSPTPTHHAFRHITITTSIYDSIPFSLRVALHTQIARTLESRATDTHSRDLLLPTIAYHYSRSDQISRRIDVSEEFGKLYFSRSQWSESSNILLPLSDFVRDNADLITRTLPAPAASKALLPDRRASWLGMAAFAAAHHKDFETSRRAATESLSLLSTDLTPLHSTLSATKSAKRALLRQLLLHLRSQGGTRLLRRRDLHHRLVSTPHRLDSEQAQFCSFTALLFEFFIGQHHGFSIDQATWFMFEALNAAIPTAVSYPAEWIALCNRAALATYWTARGLSSVYLKPFYGVGEKVGDARFVKAGYVGAIETFSGRWEEARYVFDNYARTAEIRGIKQDQLAAVFMGAQLAAMRGDFLYGHTQLLPWLTTARTVDPLWAPNAPLRVSLYHIMTGQWPDAEHHLETAMAYLHAAKEFGDYVHIGETWWALLLALKPGNPADRCQKWLEHFSSVASKLEGFDTVHYSIFEAIVVLCYAACLPVIPWRDTQDPTTPTSLLDRFNAPMVEKFTTSLRKVEGLTRRIGVKRKISFMVPAWAVVALAMHVAEKKKTAKPVRVLKRLLEGKGLGGEVFKKMMPLRGISHWMLSVAEPGSKQRHLVNARDAFAKTDASWMLHLVETSISPVPHLNRE
ncbi:hypothetical protein HDU96_010267 [Phlyctochytrium bullatum]|nr:hypothetical protein HDU96_010267 [Phlyctochytrium bullatum]